MASLRARILLSVSSLLLTPLLLEGGVRVWDRLAWGLWKVGGQPAGLYDSQPGAPPSLRPSVQVAGWQYAISINSSGFRGPELAPQPPANSLRVWCMGGSTTFDIYAPDDAHTWPAVMGQHLQQALPNRTVEVINAGVPGEILEGSALALRNKGQAIRPDIVVVHHGPNDMVAVSGAFQGDPSLAWINLSALLERMVNLRATLGLASGGLPNRLPTPHDLGTLRSRLENALKSMRGPGRTLVLATHALRPNAQMDPTTLRRTAGELPPQLGVSPAAAVAWYAAWNSLVIDVAKSWRLPLIRVDEAIGSDKTLWGDATHFSAEGSAIAGKVVADGILDQVLRQKGPR